MYICIYRNVDKQRVFNVSQTGIYRYTDEKYIQKKGEKGGSMPHAGDDTQRKGGHRIRIWDTGDRRSKTVFNGYRKEMLIIWLQAPRCPSCFA